MIGRKCFNLIAALCTCVMLGGCAGGQTEFTSLNDYAESNPQISSVVEESFEVTTAISLIEKGADSTYSSTVDLGASKNADKKKEGFIAENNLKKQNLKSDTASTESTETDSTDPTAEESTEELSTNETEEETAPAALQTSQFETLITQTVVETFIQPQTLPQTAQAAIQTQPVTQAQTQPQTTAYIPAETTIDYANVDSYYEAEFDRLVYTDRGILKQADWLLEKFRSDVNYDPTWSREEKAIRIFNWVANFMTYDSGVLDGSAKVIQNDYEWTGHGICDTYARAEVTLLNSCNVEAHYMVSWSYDHAYVDVIIDGKEYICNSLGRSFQNFKNLHLAIGWYDEEFYKENLESTYGKFEEQKDVDFSGQKLEDFLKTYGVELFHALASETEVPSDIYLDDSCGSAGCWFDLGFGVSERTPTFPGLYR